MTMQEFLAWLTEFQVPLTIGVGVVTVLILGCLIRWTIKGQRVPGLIRVVGPLLGIAWNAEATFEVLTRALHAPPVVAGVGFAVFEVLMVGAAMEAERHFRRRKDAGDPRPTLGPYKWFVFGIAFLTATAAAFNADAATVVIFRYGIATAVTSYWALRFVPDHVRDGIIKRTTWALSPRRVLVRLGVIDPTDADLTQVHHERQVRLLVSLARKIHHGSKVLRARREARFVRAAELADEAMMTEVVSRIFRAEISLEVANPNTPQERLTALARQADARRRALLTSADAVSSDVDADGNAEIDAYGPRQLTAAEPVTLTPSGTAAGTATPRQINRSDADDAMGYGPLTSAGSVNTQVGAYGNRRESGSPMLPRMPFAPEVSRQPALVRTVNLTDLADASARQALTRGTSADAQRLLTEAEDAWRTSVSQGRQLTGRELGQKFGRSESCQKFGRSESWGRTVIGNCRKRDQESQQHADRPAE